MGRFKTLTQTRPFYNTIMRHIKDIIRLKRGNEYYKGIKDIPKSRKPRGVANYELEHILD
jgi:hypothetical protein